MKKITFCFLLLGFSTFAFAKPFADRIFVNGKVWTGQFSEPWADAFAIKDGLFMEVGSNEEVQALKGENTIVTDLQGHFVSPGFIDAHVHFLTPRSVEGKLIPPQTPDELYSNLKVLLDRAASYGLTSVQNLTYDPDKLLVVQRVLKEGGLKLRFYWVVPFERTATVVDLKKYKSLSDRYPSDLLKFGGAKGFLDGVVDAQTAVMFEPYTTGKNGIAMWNQEDLDRTAALYDKQGFQIMLHATGDQAIAMALDAYEYVRKTNPPRDRRDRVECMEVPRLRDLTRFRELGVIASTQPLFANPDKTTLENYEVLLGPARASHANAFKLIDDAGAVQAFGSDWPVCSMEVLRSIYCAVARKTPEGTPPGGWYPENRISPEAALRHFTKDAAYASFDEQVKGTIGKGKYADFVVLSDNILEPPTERILKTKVLMTFMGGKQTWPSL